MINDNIYNKYNKNNPYTPELMVRMYDLDFSDIKKLILDEEVLVLGYRYKEFCDSNVEYIMLDKSNEYIYTVEQRFLDEELEDFLSDLSYSSELFILRKQSTYDVYWITKTSLKFILPNINLLEGNKINSEVDMNNKNYYEEYASIFGEKISEILETNFIKESNNVKFYSLDDLKETQNDNGFKLTHSEKLKLTGIQLLKNKPFMFFGGVCTGKILEMIFV